MEEASFLRDRTVKQTLPDTMATRVRKHLFAPSKALPRMLIHELCRLKDFNRSPRFWAEVRARMPEYEAWKKWLHTHGKELTFPPAPINRTLPAAHA